MLRDIEILERISYIYTYFFSSSPVIFQFDPRMILFSLPKLLYTRIIITAGNEYEKKEKKEKEPRVSPKYTTRTRVGIIQD